MRHPRDPKEASGRPKGSSSCRVARLLRRRAGGRRAVRPAMSPGRPRRRSRRPGRGRHRIRVPQPSVSTRWRRSRHGPRRRWCRSRSKPPPSIRPTQRSRAPPPLRRAGHAGRVTVILPPTKLPPRSRLAAAAVA